jgi:hypothetical protein
MPNNEITDALAELERCAHAVADASQAISRPSDSPGIIGALGRVQLVLSNVYDGLAQWHGAAEVGVHHAGDEDTTDPRNPGWKRAELALNEAAQYSRDAVAALERARIATMSARWFDEIRADDA